MTSRTSRFDILMATDGRFPGGTTSSVAEEIEAQHRAGYRTGLLHLPSPVLDKPRPFAPKLRKVLEEGKAELVVGVDRVEAGLLLARHPTVFTEPPRDLPQLEAEHVVLAVNQVAADDRGVLPYYDVGHVHRQIERMVGKEATWAPIGPRVRQSLERHAGSVPVLPWDWENVIDVTAWQVKRNHFVSGRPVIGRHSRGHWTKWPDSPAEILAAYPRDPRYSVRILGGTDAPAQILDRIPANWVDLPFNSVSARDFLATIDFFVYFHHPGLIEAFGRVVLEALAAGAVAIGPPYLEQLFGDACLYGTPADVRRYVDELYADWDAYAARSWAGIELAQKRFSYETHVDRVETLIGKPSVAADARPSRAARPEPAGRPAARRRGGTLVVDVRWDTTGESVLSSVVEQAWSAGEPRAVVVPAWRAVEIGQRATKRSTSRGTSASPRDVAVETFPWVLAELSAVERRRYLALRLTGLLETHRPARIVVLDGGGPDAQMVLDVAGGSAVEVLRVHRPAAGSTGSTGDGAPGWTLPDGWVVSHASAGVHPPAGPRRSRLASLRRKAPTWARTTARRSMSRLRRRRVRLLERVAPSSGLMLFEVGRAELSLPVHTAVTHPAPERLPAALLVVTGEKVEAGPTLRALVERAQITTGFRPAVLAPSSWVDEALGFGVTLETLVPEALWTMVYGTGWSEYLRRRVDETCQVIHPTTIAFVDQTIQPAGRGDTPSAVLDILEMARTRRRA